jgi:FAD/FMN-containing dehydrogenase
VQNKVDARDPDRVIYGMKPPENWRLGCRRTTPFRPARGRPANAAAGSAWPLRLWSWPRFVIFVGCPASLVTRAWVQDQPVVDHLPPGYVDDASRMNRTHVAEVFSIPSQPQAAEAQLRDLLQRARAGHVSVAIGGARHSMGGHTISPDGIVLDMLPFHAMSLDARRQILHVGSGARWSQVIPYLDARGYSVEVMQAFNDFSVGGSMSVNCHGWQHNHAPFASTVESFRLMKADGTIVTCSRTENRDLFSLVLGGYGLFGVILDADVHVVPNERYRADVEVLPADWYAKRYAQKLNGAADIGMVYGRLCVVPGKNTFLREAILAVFRKAPCPASEIPPLADPAFQKLRREVYRAQIGSRTGKKVRWTAEKTFGEQFNGTYVSRNQLLNEGAEVYQERNADHTDILHEYFIPVAKFAVFLDRAHEIIPKHKADLLNVTVRNVTADSDSFLRYADQEMFSFVMLFNQPRTAEADQQMESLTKELIDASLACGGRYYLPYRIHATKQQFQRAYPKSDQFFEQKRKFDPDGIFQNQFSIKYGRGAS